MESNEERGYPVVLAVDDSAANLKLVKNALTKKFAVFTVPSARKMFAFLESETDLLPDLILLDIAMPEMSGYEAIKRLKEDERTRNIPIIFLTAHDSPEKEIEGLTLGAVDYVAKPIIPPILLQRVGVHITLERQRQKLAMQAKELESQRLALVQFNESLQSLVEEKSGDVIQLQNVILQTVVNLVENRDDITGRHIERTQKDLKIMVDGLKAMGLYQEQVEAWNVDVLLQSSLLHDVGKIAVSDTILNKPGKLTPEEFEEIKKHPVAGARIIDNIMASVNDGTFLNYARIFAEAHQEKWDGSGYPYGLSGENIPLEGRIMDVVDVYDALISERPYKKAFSHDAAVEIIRNGKGTHFDPVLVDVFLTVADKFRDVG
ncbi:MAG: response regulator [Synergistaceae bacterium]|nr:response regulator [Synergistaceae bacterium]